MTLVLSRALLRPALRRSGCVRLAGAAVAATGLTVLTSLEEGGSNASLGLLLAAVVLCAGVAGCVDDEAATTLAASPTPLLWRRGARFVLASAVASGVWAALVVLARALSDAVVVVAGRQVTVALVISLAVAAFASSEVVLPALGISIVIASRMPRGWALLVAPGSADWPAAQHRWLVVLAIGLLVLSFSCRDPAARALARRGP